MGALVPGLVRRAGLVLRAGLVRCAGLIRGFRAYGRGGLGLGLGGIPERQRRRVLQCGLPGNRARAEGRGCRIGLRRDAADVAALRGGVARGDAVAPRRRVGGCDGGVAEREGRVGRISWIRRRDCGCRRRGGGGSRAGRSSGCGSGGVGRGGRGWSSAVTFHHRDTIGTLPDGDQVSAAVAGLRQVDRVAVLVEDRIGSAEEGVAKNSDGGGWSALADGHSTRAQGQSLLSVAGWVPRMQVFVDES